MNEVSKLFTMKKVENTFGISLPQISANLSQNFGLSSQVRRGRSENSEGGQESMEAVKEIEGIMVELQEKGVVMEPAKKLEIDNLLKNSVFSSTMLLNLINDLLDLAKIENSSFKLNGTYFDLFDVIEKSAETLDSQLGFKKILVTHSYN